MMAARLRRGTTLASCAVCNLYSRGWKDRGMLAQNAATILKPSCPIPTQPLLHMTQHVADWVAPFPRSQHPTPPALIFLHTHPSPHPSSSLLYAGRGGGGRSHVSRRLRNWRLSEITCCRLRTPPETPRTTSEHFIVLRSLGGKR